METIILKVDLRILKGNAQQELHTSSQPMAAGVWLLYIQQLKDNVVFTGTHNWKGKTIFKKKKKKTERKTKKKKSVKPHYSNFIF